MPRNATIETILATGTMGKAWRVLTVDLDWPAGDPPFPAGDYVTVPAIGTPPAYDPTTFDAAVWTDCTGLAADYHITQDISQQCDQASIAVAAAWRSDLALAFREMRLVKIQQRLRAGVHDTGWLDLFTGLSDGFSENWRGGAHGYVVNVKDVLKLAGLEILGAITGSRVYQADLIQVGTYDTPRALQLVNTAADAYEYGITSDGLTTGPIHPNWSDKPGPLVWCTNARDKDGVLWPDPVPLTIGGQAVQAVFGEGIIRLGDTWAHTTSANNEGTDFSQGLGIPGGTAPTLTVVGFRFAHPAVTDRRPTPLAVPSDVTDSLTVIASSAGSVQLSAAVNAVGLTLVMRDGSGLRYATLPSATPATPTDTLTLADSAAVVELHACSYGDANRATDVIQRVMIDCGYQQIDGSAPFYLNTPSKPLIKGVAQDITLPPVVVKDTEEISALELLARLRNQGYLPANYYTYADAAGTVWTKSVTQLTAGNAASIPVTAMPEEPGFSYDRNDLNIATRVVARGIPRQVTDATQAIGVTIDDVTPAAGGLPDPATYTFAGVGISGHQVRGAATPPDYHFALSSLFLRGGANTDLTLASLAAWSWLLYFPWTNAADDKLVHAAWENRLLCEITLPAPVSIDAVEIRADNAWLYDTTLAGYGFSRGAAYPQTLAVEYYAEDLHIWLPLISNWTQPVDAMVAQRKDAGDFDSRTAVTTDRIRLRCITPFFAGFYRNKYHVTGRYLLGAQRWFYAGVWLSQLKLWSSAEIRGTAELGNASNYGSELVAEPWPTIRQRLRSRTFILPEPAPWVNDQTTADWLALEWLKDRTKDMAPRQFGAVYPTIRRFDTVVAENPRGESASYLVIRTDMTSADGVNLAGTNYAEPYFEEL